MNLSANERFSYLLKSFGNPNTKYIIILKGSYKNKFMIEHVLFKKESLHLVHTVLSK